MTAARDETACSSINRKRTADARRIYTRPIRDWTNGEIVWLQASKQASKPARTKIVAGCLLFGRRVPLRESPPGIPKNLVGILL